MSGSGPGEARAGERPRRIGIVLFNLGGPDSLDSVEPFLENLFKDPAILAVPGLVRPFLARLIAKRRAKVAREIYAQMGNRSPIVPQTEIQARALEAALAERGFEAKAVIAMRYWHPFAREAAAELKAFDPDHVVLLPLYPQFSTTTSGSSLGDWRKAAKAAGLAKPESAVCCYPTAAGVVRAHADLVRKHLAEVPRDRPVRVLFSAHGLPEYVVKGGDPYQWQVERTSAAVAEAAGLSADEWQISYQSRVGPLTWIGPSTESEIERAGEEKIGLLVVPIAFVSEHSETLVELDIEYGELAEEKGVPWYGRVPALQDHPAFVDALAELSAEAAGRDTLCGENNRRTCPERFTKCPCRASLGVGLEAADGAATGTAGAAAGGTAGSAAAGSGVREPVGKVAE